MTQSMPEKILEMMVARVPARRIGQPEEVASAFLFLASEEAAYINGAVLSVDGGMVTGNVGAHGCAPLVGAAAWQFPRRGGARTTLLIRHIFLAPPLHPTGHAFLAPPLHNDHPHKHPRPGWR